MTIRVAGGRLVPRTARVSHANALHTWKEREGIVLSLRPDGGSSDASSGLGEASPLPGYSRDDLAICAAQLEGCWDRLPAIDAEAPIGDTLRAVVARAGVTAPAAMFALESAVLDLVAKARRLPAWAVLRGDEGAVAIPLSALAEGTTPEDLAADAERASKRGLRAVKVKVGGPDGATRDPLRLAAIRARLGDAVALRLDANQTLPEAELRARLDALAAFGPELLEEPTTPSAFAELRESPIALALDESLALPNWEQRLTQAAARGTCVAVVLKPMALGGLLRCLAIADAAGALGVAAIVTHLFDGPVASAAAACVALAIRRRVLPCGLDAHGRLERPVAALTPTEIVPFDAHGLGVDLT